MEYRENYSDDAQLRKLVNSELRMRATSKPTLSTLAANFKIYIDK
jgi:hypothetical protein